MCPPMSRESHGQPSLTSPLPNGRFHQWANLVQYLSSNPVKPPFVHSTHPICWQTPHRTGTLWSSSRQWLLRKTHHFRDWTGPGISWVYARNQTFGANLWRTNQYLSSSLTLFSLSSSCPSERLPLTLSHCHQGCFPSFSCSTRFDPVNSFVYSRWVSQGRTPDNFRPTLDSASEPPIAASNKGFPLARPRFDVVSRVFLGFLFFLFFSLVVSSSPFPLVVLCFFVFLLAASWLNLRSLFPPCGDIPPDGSRSSSRFPSPPGSGSDAFGLFGGASSLFRALHWKGGPFASSKSSSWKHEITQPTHFRSFASIVSFTNIGNTWRDPVLYGRKS